MNFLLLEAIGKHLVFRGGKLEGRIFAGGETVFVRGSEISFQIVDLSPPPSSHYNSRIVQNSSISDFKAATIATTTKNEEIYIYDEPWQYGVWCLERRFLRGRPAVSCQFFNKRTTQIEQRYLKIFNSDGYYLCGPRFPRKARSVEHDRTPIKQAA